MITYVDYPIKNEIDDSYHITVNGKEVNAVKTRVSAMPFNRYWPGKQRATDQTEIAAYLSVFTDGEPLSVSVSTAKEFHNAVIRPLSKDVNPQIVDGRICFTVYKHGYYTVELDGSHNALHLFVEPSRMLEVDRKKKDPTELYFGPGVHRIGHKELFSNTRVYIHRDAVVYGSFFAVNAQNIKIVGDGVLDGGLYERQTKNFLLVYDYGRVPAASWEYRQMNAFISENKELFTDASSYVKGSGTFIYRGREHFNKLLEAMDPVQTGLSFYACENIEVQGIIFRNCAGLSLTQAACKNVHYSRVKIIGNWRYNSDGIDFYNCRDCSVKDSFLRTFDDTVCVKGQVGWDTLPSSDILVENCVLWNDWGHAFDIGVDTVAPEIYNITVRDCDFIHSSRAVIDIGNMDRAYIHDITFENIRVEYSSDDREQVLQELDEDKFSSHRATPILAEIHLGCNMWSIDGICGKISGVTFKNIYVYGEEESFLSEINVKGLDEEHCISGVIFDGVFYNGRRLLPSELNINANEFGQTLIK